MREERVLSQATDTYWISAQRQKPGYPRAGDGKWLVHARSIGIDNLWRIVKQATEEGYLGSGSKVSTPMLPYTRETGIHIICIYTYDRQDYEDIMRIRAALRTLGIEQKIDYAILTDQEQIILYHE
jgi:hypothetical protein